MNIKMLHGAVKIPSLWKLNDSMSYATSNIYKRTKYLQENTYNRIMIYKIVSFSPVSGQECVTCFSNFA